MFQLLVFFLLSLCPLQAGPVEFVVVIPSYNNEQWCIKNLETVVNQTYCHWSIIYINDCSTDKTGALVEAYIQENNLQNRCKVIHNASRIGAMANYYAAISSCSGDKVIATLDGDDRLAHDAVLEKIAKIYKDSDVWCTHGNYRNEPFTSKSYLTAYPEEVQRMCAFRNHIWLGGQLRTFYAKLFHRIKEKDLKYRGEFVSMASDIAFMLPILEMASDGHIRFIEEPIYIINTANPLSDNKRNPTLQRDLDLYIRSRDKYNPLKKLFL